jgi:hypothetical protein
MFNLDPINATRFAQRVWAERWPKPEGDPGDQATVITQPGLPARLLTLTGDLLIACGHRLKARAVPVLHDAYP